MEEMVISHFCHEHPLILTENVGDKGILCYGCRNLVISEPAYVCTHQYCPSKTILHKRCAELPRIIFHPSHPLHPLHLYDFQQKWLLCRICGSTVESVLGYRCSSCNFGFDITCPQLGSIYELLEKKRLQHPSHIHPLTLMRKPNSLFNCDGCGTDGWDMAYVCSICEFWIHNRCASLPLTLQTCHHHHHLSLVFNLPIEYRNFFYNCDVCLKELHPTCWVYYCRDCRYFAHVMCATMTNTILPAELSILSDEERDGFGLIQLPVRDISKELITPFIMRESGLDKIPDTKDMPLSITMPETTASYSVIFNYHKHPLSLVSEGPTNELMICDVCITPVYSTPYYHCPTCNKYFVHATCYLLPKTLSCPHPLQLYGECPQALENHKLTLYTGSELDNRYAVTCRLCLFESNGRVYGCEECKLMLDVKCAALPTIIKHASHQEHKLLMRRTQKEEFTVRSCGGCGVIFREDLHFVAYYCTGLGCDFALDMKCVLLPQSLKHEWDKHPLLLTYDASKDHPTDFYCEVCEEEMHPKMWMYHCRECDHSFHTLCIKGCDMHRNVKCGREVWFDHRLHPHPLTMITVTLKLRCDACKKYSYMGGGFECASCNYALCYPCGVTELGKM